MRGGANGARVRLAPQKDWAVNQPAELRRCCGAREDPAGLQRAQTGGKKVSLADLIVLAGCAGVEGAAKRAGHDVACRSRPAAPTRRRR
jgi:catalase-peroxidase